MNFTNLTYFLFLAEELNFTSASNKLYISQQSLSAHIAKLEKTFDVKLFERTQPLKLTPAGHTFYKYAEHFLTLKKNLESEMNYIKNEQILEITVGSTVSRGAIILPSLIKKYSETHPKTKINIIQKRSSNELEELLFKKQTDIIIGFTPHKNPLFESIFLTSEDYLLGIPENILKEYFPNNFSSIIKALKKEIDLDLIKSCPFIAMPSNTYSGFVLNKLCLKHNIVPNIALEVGNIETQLALLYKGLGIVFIPKLFVDCHKYTLDEKKIYFFNTKEPITKNISISATYLKNSNLPKHIIDFIDIASEFFNTKTSCY
ncbi:MAG: LysR family transcriptional regulator [Fusobacterium sp. JB021]|nr:LysR family transcriptional regulator [Fusobacterium sp. JB021]MDP0507211.1 LysR family transcriptional regulator [Fusobacterium sp. JB019]